jgi:hypothetical protein
MLINVGVEIVHDFVKLLFHFNILVLLIWFTDFAFDKDDGLDGIFLGGLIPFAI